MDVNPLQPKCTKTDKVAGRTTMKQLSQFCQTASTCNDTGSLFPHVRWNEDVHYVERFEVSNNLVELVGQKTTFQVYSFNFYRWSI